MRKVFEELNDAAAVKALHYPEGLTVEYKGEVPRPKSLAKTCCAFANTSGGLLVVGIENPKAEGAVPKCFPGVPALSDPVRKIETTLANTIVPAANVETKRMTFRGEKSEELCYVAVLVEPSDDLHQVSIDDVGTFYRRVGSNSVPMSSEEIRTRLEAASRFSQLLDNRMAERLAQLSSSEPFLYAAVAPDSPFAAPVLDPSAPEFRGQLQRRLEGVGRLTRGGKVEPSNRGCRSASPYPADYTELAVGRDGVCDLLDRPAIGPPESFVDRESGTYSHGSLGFVRRMKQDETGGMVGNEVWAERLASDFSQFLGLSAAALRLMGYGGRLRIKATFAPADGHSLVLMVPYNRSEMQRKLDGGRLDIEARASVPMLEADPRATVRALELRLFESFGVENIREDVERAIEGAR